VNDTAKVVRDPVKIPATTLCQHSTLFRIGSKKAHANFHLI